MEERRPLLKRRAFSSPAVDLRMHWQRRLACILVLVIETLERIAFYSLAGNLVLFLNMHPLNWLSYNAVSANFVFMGIGFSMSLLGGFVADRLFGRWLTLVISFVIYIAGYIIFPLIASYDDEIPPFCHWNSPMQNMSHTPVPISNGSWVPVDPYSDLSNNGPCQWLIYLALFLVAVGYGTVKASIAPFGADQIKAEGEGEVRRFFNWFYWFVNLGSLIALGGVAFIQQSGIPVIHKAHKHFDGFFYGYVIPISCLGVALLLTILGKTVFLIREPSGSMLGNICNIMREACRSRRRYRRRQQVLKSESDSHHSGSFTDVDVAGGAAASYQNSITWLDWAKVRYGGNYHESMVEDVKSLGRMMLVFLALIPYWLVYFQIESNFLIQGLHMKLQKTMQDPPFQIPAAWLSLFDVIILIFLIPFLDYIVYPALAKRNQIPSLLTRICIGMAFALVAVTIAGGVENYRLKLWHAGHCFNQTIGNTTYYAADLWIFYQIPQYLLIGISEAFASVAGLEFAYSQAPRAMRSVTTGLFWVFSGMGSFLGVALMHLAKLPGWFNDTDFGNINKEHLDYYFFLLGAIQLLTLVIFAVVARNYDMGIAGKILLRTSSHVRVAPPASTPYYSQQAGINASQLTREMSNESTR